VRAGDAVLAGPLVGDALDVLARAVVEEDVVDEAVVVVERHAVAAAEGDGTDFQKGEE
jgi:serine acetyltransferase